jgi:hypothetical protein
VNPPERKERKREINNKERGKQGIKIGIKNWLSKNWD